MLITLTTLSCQRQHCKYINEIGFILSLESAIDQQNICNCYDQNREKFYQHKNETDQYGSEQIQNILTESNVSQKAIDEFLKNWQTIAGEHRKQTQLRDSIYKKGLTCLQKIIPERSVDFNEFIGKNKSLVASTLTKKQIHQIKKGIEDYRRFNKNNKQDFLEEETMMYGRKGENMIAYNQLSFDIIDQFMTSEYRFGFKKNFKKDMLELYDNNPGLLRVYKEYRIVEEKVVKEITSEDCFKRIGILRYYDDLDVEHKEQAIKVNMLMNFFK